MIVKARKFLQTTIAICSFISLQALSNEPVRAIEDLRYGVVLYNYYQQQWFEAISESTLAKSQGGIKDHQDYPLLVEGGSRLAFGMQASAESIFKSLLKKNESEKVQNAAWYYLAKIQYQQGLFDRSKSTIQNISSVNGAKYASDLLALKTNLSIQTDNLSEAEYYIKEEKQQDTTWAPFLYFNLANAYSRKGKYKESRVFYQKALTYINQHENHLELRDKILTALAYSYMLAGEAASAIPYFKKVRLHGLLSDRALLGYGWAAAKVKDYRQALKPWVHLAQTSKYKRTTQEVLLAVPYAYEQMGMRSVALETFQQAEQKLLRELEDIKNMRLSISRLSLDNLLKFKAVTKDSSVISRKMTSVLADVIAMNAFRRKLQEVNELLFLKSKIAEWNGKVELYSQLIVNKQKYRSKIISYNKYQELEDRLASIKNKKSVIENKIIDFNRNGRPEQLMVVDKESNFFIIKRLMEKYKKLIMIDNVDESTKLKIDFFKGLLLWAGNEKYFENMWAIKKSHSRLDALHQKSEMAIVRVKNTLSQAKDLDEYRAKLYRSKKLLLQKNSDVDRRFLKIQEDIRSVISKYLEKKEKRTRSYLSQAALSIARLSELDSSLTKPQVEGDPDGGS